MVAVSEVYTNYKQWLIHFIRYAQVYPIENQLI